MSLSQHVIYTPQSAFPDPLTGGTCTPPPVRRPGSTHDPVSFGGSWEFGEMLICWAHKLGVSLQEAIDFRGWTWANPHIKESQHLLLDMIHEFTYFEGGRPLSPVVSMSVAFINMLGAQTEIVEMSNMSVNDINSSLYQNTNYNTPNLVPPIQTAIDELVFSVQEHNEELAKM
jgi:hypothetical protein